MEVVMLSHINVEELGIVIVDHGSRQEKSNRLFVELVERFQRATPYSIVEPAHMELAEPSLPSAFHRCVERGARLIVVHPYFLLPGRHWEEDIPRLAADAARRNPDIRYLVTAPLGLHELMLQVICDRVQQCLKHALQDSDACELCQNSDRCQVRDGESS
jgi:sirohydrochlorin ferrochelatase